MIVRLTQKGTCSIQSSMKSSIIRNNHSPRNQETNLAPATSASGGGTGSSRLTPEMCKAIKRQEITSGVDYWKVGHNGIAPHVHDKRPTYSRVTQINLDFPGAFLPNVSQQQQQQQSPPPPQQKPKRKETSGLVLNRSRTTFMPSILQPKVRIDKVSTNKKTITDLTCLQLADTLFASKSSGFAGFFNFTIPKSSYGDIFGTDSECNGTSGGDKAVPVVGTRPNDPRNRSVNSAIKYRTFQADDGRTDERGDQLYSPTSPMFPPRWNDLFGDNKKELNLKPQKSILKNGVNGKPGDDGEDLIVSPDPHHRDTNLSFQNHNSLSPTNRYHGTHVKLDAIHPVMQRHDSHDSPRQFRPGDSRSHPPGVDLQITGVVSDFSTRKRSVRFNADHEIREYKPCEPVTYY